MGNRRVFNTLVWLGVAFAVLLMLIVDYNQRPWIDEVGTADSAINWVTKGEWRSNVWNYTYQPAYTVVLAGWLSVFGVSHAAVCNLGVFLTLLCFVFVGRKLTRGREPFVPDVRSAVLFSLLFWVPFASWWAGFGRIDTLAMLAGAVFVACLLQADVSAWGGRLAIFLSAALLMLSTLYAIPVAALFAVFLFVFDYGRRGRACWFFKGLWAASGFVVGMALTLAFHAHHNFLLHYIGAPLTGATAPWWNLVMRTLHSLVGLPLDEGNLLLRLMHGYTSEPATVVLCALCWLLLVAARRRGKAGRDEMLLLAFVSSVPLVFTLFGRCNRDYLWSFSVPTFALFVHLLGRGPWRKWLRWWSVGVFVLLVSSVEIARFCTYYVLPSPSRAEMMRRTMRFLDSHSDILSAADNIYVAHTTPNLDIYGYYQMVPYGKELWLLYYDNIDVPDVVAGCAPLRSLLSAVGYEERQPSPYLPDSGVMFVAPHTAPFSSQAFAERFVDTDTIVAEDGFALLRFRRNGVPRPSSGGVHN